MEIASQDKVTVLVHLKDILRALLLSNPSEFLLRKMGCPGKLDVELVGKTGLLITWTGERNDVTLTQNRYIPQDAARPAGV